VGDKSTMTASWYGEPFHGRKTANGETYDMNAMTAAHKEYPFGTLLRVTYPKTGRSVTVRINDRGPFVMGRQLDLSYAAARQLGMLPEGVGRVRVEVVAVDEGEDLVAVRGTTPKPAAVPATAATPSAPKPAPAARFSVQSRPYVSLTEAERVRRGLPGLDARIHALGEGGYAVRIDGFTSGPAAAACAATLRQKGIEATVVRDGAAPSA
jgi:rare lipoprotein A